MKYPQFKEDQMGVRRLVRGLYLMTVTVLAWFIVADVWAEDAYIESDGHQTVNLRAFKTPNTRIWMDFQTTVELDDTAHYLFGTDGDATGSWVAFYADKNGSFYFKIGDAASFIKAQSYDMARHTMEIAFNENGSGTHRLVFTTGAETNLNTTSSVASSVTTSGCPMMLFGLGSNAKNAEAASKLTSMKVYGVKIWEGSSLTHDYVPRKVEGKYCFKDLVDGKFVSGVSRLNGSPAGVLSGGGDIVEELGDGYIESHAHERINLGIKADTTTRVELDHQFVNYENYKEQYLLGSRAQDNKSLTFWTWDSSYGARLGYACVTNSNDVWADDNYFSKDATDGIAISDLRRTIIIDAYGRKVTYETSGYECFSLEMTRSPMTFAETQDNLGLFRVRSGTGWGSASAIRFYGLKIYKEGDLVRSFMPYVQNALPGVLDQNGNFLASDDELSYTNQQFSIGGNISGDVGMDDVYLETTGNEVVGTGFVPTADTRIVIDFVQLDPGSDDVSYLFGCRDASDVGPFVWAGMDNWRVYAGTAGTKWQAITPSRVLNMGRYALTMDLKAAKATLTQGGKMIATTDLIAAEPLPTTPLALLGIAEKSSFLSGSKVRLYSCQIYDGDELKRNYYPQMKDGQIGLFDKVKGEFVGTLQTNGAKLRGKTVDGVCLNYTKTPVASADVYRDETLTLSAEAPFAASYVWRCDGKVIEGATDGSLTVSARNRHQTVRYTVNPIYVLNPVVGARDREAEGVTAETIVTFHRTIGPGMIHLVR